MANEQQPEITETDIRAIAAQMDSEGIDGDSVVELPEATTGQAEEKPEGSVSPEEVTPESQDQSQQEAKDTQAEIDYRAEYERMKKDYERQDRSWKRLNEEKEALAKLRQTTRPEETRASGDQFSAEEYEQYAEKLVDEGNVADAKRAMSRAKEIRQKAFVEKYNEAVKEAIDEEPELANQASDLAQAVQKLITTDPSFGGVPTGFKNAVRLVKAEKLAGSIPGLQGELNNYKKEIERLNKAMEIGGKGNLPKREGSKSFNDMSMSEMREHIRNRAAEADADYNN